MRKRSGRSFLLGIAWAAPLFAGAAWAAESRAIDPCSIEIRNYSQTVSWFRSRNRIQVTASDACATKLSAGFDLSQVELQIQIPGQAPKILRTSHALFLPLQNRLQIQSAHESLIVDFNSGEVRSPSGYYRDLRQKQTSL